MPDPPFLESQKRPEWRAITAITADLLNWTPGYPYMGSEMPVQGRQLPAAQVIVPNPPFLEAQKRPEWRTITAVSLLTWVPDYPYLGERQPLQGGILPPPLELVPNPPFPGDLDPRLIYLQRLLWDPPPPPPVFYRRLVQGAAAVDNPPFGIYSWLWTILNQWQFAPTIFQGQKLSPGVPGQSVDPAPLIYQVIRDEILRLWDPPPPFPPQKGPLAPGIPGQSIDSPPRLIRSPLFPDQLVIPVQARILRPIIGVDSPPFNLPADWLWTTLLAWQLDRQPPTRLARLIQASGAPASTTTTPNILDLLDLLTVLK